MALTSTALRPDDASFANSQSAYSDYYKAFANNYNMSGWPSWRSNEHTSIMNFVPRSAATKVFCPRSGATNVNSGNWNVASNWWPNGVPAANDKVVIGEGTTCTYDITANAPDLTWLRQDGALVFAHNANAHILLDTWVATESAAIRIGSEALPVQASNTISIEISAARGVIDVVADTFKQSRGCIWMGKPESGGETRIFGAPKTHALRVSSHTGPLAGASTLTLESPPVGWAIGDRIQLPQTYYAQSQGFNEYNWGARRWEDDVVTVTAINGSTITFTPALTYSHNAPVSPWGDQQPKCWVRNLSRNIVISTRNASTTPIERWGHTMWMHTNHVTCDSVKFLSLGRTVKLGGGGQAGNGGGITPGGNGWASTNAGTPWPLVGRWCSGGVANLPTEALLYFKTNPTNGWPISITVNGEDARGNVISETFSINNGVRTTPFTTQWHINDTSEPRTEKFFKKITQITADKNVSLSWFNGGVTWFSRSFRMTGSGVRIPRGGPTDASSASWVYEPVNAGTNIQGRYAVHIHRGGTGMAEVRANGVIRGCVVEDSPGWGYAHHGTHFNFIEDIAYKVGGSGFVSENGAETGTWSKCHASYIYGADNLTKDDDIVAWGDPGQGSHGGWWSGRAVHAQDCVFDSVVTAYSFNSRHSEGPTHRDEELDIPEVFRGLSPNIGTASVPVQRFVRNEGFACQEYLHITKTSPQQGHDKRTVLEDMFGWSCHTGAILEYTSHYTTIRPTFIKATSSSAYGHSNQGWAIANNLTTDQVIIRPRISGFELSLNLSHAMFGSTSTYAPANRRIVVDADLIGGSISDQNAIDRFISSSSYPSLNPPVSLNLSSVHPSPGFVSRATHALRVDGTGGATWSGWRTHGTAGLTTKTDRLGTDEYPTGAFIDQPNINGAPMADWIDIKSGGEMDTIVRRDGFWTNTVDSQKYVFIDEIFTDRVTGEPFKEVIPCNYNTYSGSENRGSTTLTNNSGPTASDFAVSCPANGSVQISPLANASHSGSRQIMLRGNTQPGFGSVVRDGYSDTSPGSGTLTYIPQRGFNGADTFKYWIMDQDGNLASTRGNTVTVNVSAGVPVFQANPDSATAAYETPVVFNVLTNDIGSGLTVTASAVTSGGGSVSHASGGNITYTPASGFTGIATGTATVRDAALSTQVSTWSVFVSSPGSPPPSPNAPVPPAAVTLRVRAGKLYGFNAVAGTVDPQGSPLSINGASVTDLTKVQVTDTFASVVYFRPLAAGSATVNVEIRNAAQLAATRVINLVITTRGRRFGKG
jgi:hypothetical protein